MNYPHSDENGFTIIELMIATAVFSVVLLLCATAIVQVGKMFNRGVLINRTQNVSRIVSDDISQSIQFGARSASFDVTAAPATFNDVVVQARCLGEVRYSYTLARSLGSGANQSKHVLWKDHITSGGTCSVLDITAATPAGSPDGMELLGANMRIAELSVTNNSGLWKIKTVVSYGEEDDMFVSGSNFTQCESFSRGGQFCVVSTINTNAVKRL